MLEFDQLKKNYLAHKTVVVGYNDKSKGKKITLNYNGINNTIQHEIDCLILSEAISILIRDYKKRGNNDALLLKAVVNNLEQNFIKVEDTVVRGR